MESSDIKKFLVQESVTIRTALEAIDRESHGFVMVIDQTGRYLGMVTDGDIRRAFLNGHAIGDPVLRAMPRVSTTLPVSATPEEIQAKLSEVIRVIPLLDADGKPADFAAFSRLRRIPVLEPSLDGNELSYVTQCIVTNWISSQGKFVSQFEEQIGHYVGVPNAVATANGTVALHLALQTLGIGPGDEVVVPNLTFAATINSVIYTGATPVIVDVERETWGLDPDAFGDSINPRTKAVIPVHLYGQPCKIEAIHEIASKSGILVVEDCAEAIGSTVNGRMVGSFGDAAMFSFFGNKTITTGEGGMVLFREKRHSERARVLRDHGMSKTQRYWHDEVGFNYRMTNLQAAIGVAQMERVDKFIEAKISIGRIYDSILGQCKQIELPPRNAWSVNTHWLYTAVMSPEASVGSKELLEKLLKVGIEGRPVFYPLHAMPPYQKFAKSEFRVSSYLSKNGFSLPSSVGLNMDQVRYIANTVCDIIANREALQK